jgi:carbon monoxide dehydrogenase subunit G
MEISGQHRFSAPRERVWELLLDPKILQQCLPGAEDLVEVGPEEYEARMKIGVAAIRGTYQGRVKIVEKDEPNSYRMAVEGKGPAGQISGDAKIDLAGTATGPSSTGQVTPTCAALWPVLAAVSCSLRQR